MRTIIIGDIHGCAEEMKGLLVKLAIGPQDQLMLLGDLFDRGPDSWEIFQVVQNSAASMGQRFILLRGNHEDYLLHCKLFVAGCDFRRA